MEKILLKVFVIAFITMLTCVKPCFAGVEPYENFLSGNIRKNDTLVVKDEKFKNPSFNWADITNISVKNILTLRVINNQPISQDFSCTAILKVEYFSTPEQSVPTVIDEVNLSVNYSKSGGVNYKISDSYTFENGYYVKVTVLDISSPQFGTEIPPVLQLSSNIIIDRQYLFKPAEVLSPHVGVSNASNPQSGGEVSNSPSNSNSNGSNLSLLSMSAMSPEVNVSASGFALSWNSIPGAEEYDIEWTTVDEGGEHTGTINQMLAGTSLPLHVLGSLFKNNATRISTHGNTYMLSPASNAKYLIVRMRQVQYQGNLRLEGNWDYKLTSDAYMLWAMSWHESNKNWQYSAVYAEDGKKKETITYFDGSLRGRQTATINNSDNVAVVQENVYDQFGRQVASILPAPAKHGNGTQFLHYFNKFNLDTLGRPYGFASLDPTDCEISPGRMLADSGASRYYSNQNPFISSKNYNRYIPDAEGYPLSLTQYTPDNTGRVKFQGGVGPMFQPGQNHGRKLTKYYYGKPEQWELDRLFGNDVGYAHRYLKNMVVDPNGQISISYLNASGKTIATALTGSAPVGMDGLNTLPEKKLQTARILQPDQFVFNSSDLKLSATTTYLASVPGPAAISYSINKLINKQTAGTFEICSNCYYDLKVSISDDCNVEVFTTTDSVKIGSELANCTNEGLQSGNINVSFPKIGEYHISFEFQLSRPGIENYTSKFIEKGQEHGTIRREFSFIKEYLDSLDLNSFFGDCRNCKEALGTKQVFIERVAVMMRELEADSASVEHPDFKSWLGVKHDELLANCGVLEENCVSPCAEYERLMGEDVSPGGQYALFDSLGTAFETELNVLYKYFRIEFPLAEEGSTAYNSALITEEDGTVTSPYSANFGFPMMIKYWKDEWAPRFVKYHPEYCKLQFCGLNTASLNWDNRVKEQVNKATDTIPGGQNIVYQNNNGAWLLAADPFFATGGLGAAHFTAMQNDLNEYSQRVVGVNHPGSQVKSLSQFVDYMMYCVNPRSNTNTGSDNWNNCTPAANCRIPDKEWALYRDKYFEIKEKYYQIVRDNTSCNAACTTGTPHVLGQPGVLTIKDFAISRGSLLLGCGGSQREMILTSSKGKVATAVTVEIYYPGLASPLNIQFVAGEVSKEFCVPRILPVSSIKISDVN